MKELLKYVEANSSIEIFMLLLFVGTFLGMGLWVYRKSARQKYDFESQLPLKD